MNLVLDEEVSFFDEYYGALEVWDERFDSSDAWWSDHQRAPGDT